MPNNQANQEKGNMGGGQQPNRQGQSSNPGRGSQGTAGHGQQAGGSQGQHSGKQGGGKQSGSFDSTRSQGQFSDEEDEEMVTGRSASKGDWSPAGGENRTKQ